MAESQVNEVALKYVADDNSVKQTNRYKAYPEYKDSGVEWLGDIPSGWEVIRLKYVVDLVGNKTNENSGKYIGLENIESMTGKYLVTENVTPEGVSNTFNKGNVLFGKLRPYLAKSWLASFSGICSSEFLVLDSKLIHPKFLNYFTLTEAFIEEVNSSTYGTKMPRASWDFIALLPVPVMEYELSKKIANFLDYETATIDTLIEKQQRLIELLTEKRQAVISHAVTKGLNPNVPMKDSEVEWLGEVPEHWEVVKGGYIGQLFGSESISEDKVVEEGEVPFIKVSTLTTDGFEISKPEWFVDKRIDKYINKRSGYIVFPKRGAAIFTNKVNVVYTPSVIDPNLMGWILNDNAINEFVALVLKTRRLDDIADVSTVPQINNKHINPEKFPLPPIEEQRKIVDYLLKKTNAFEKLIDLANQQIQLMQERRTALISAAVTGKIDVRDWVKPE